MANKFTKEELSERYSKALARASNPRSIPNMVTVFEAAAAKGIDDAMPGENVLTFNAWKAKGRVVMKGEKALCKVAVVFNTDNGETDKKVMTMAAVFHVSQTKEIDA